MAGDSSCLNGVLYASAIEHGRSSSRRLVARTFSLNILGCANRDGKPYGRGRARFVSSRWRKPKVQYDDHHSWEAFMLSPEASVSFMEIGDVSI
jgi:hypothetical protein